MCCHCPQGWAAVQHLFSFLNRKTFGAAWQLLPGSALRTTRLLNLTQTLPILTLWAADSCRGLAQFRIPVFFNGLSVKTWPPTIKCQLDSRCWEKAINSIYAQPAWQSDLHILSTAMQHRGVRRAPNMTNDWLHNVFDCAAVCWHFTNGSECVCARVCFCQSDSSLLICRPAVHTNKGTHLHSNWSVAVFSLSDPETLWSLCIRLQFGLDAAFIHEGQSWAEQSILRAGKYITHLLYLLI